MFSKHWARLFPLVFALAFSVIALPAHAATAPQPSGHYTHQIDWAHPHRAHLPRPGMARSGVGSDATGDLMPNAGITPLGYFPTTCYNNYYYDVIVQGNTTWTYTSGNLKAWVQYQWCPQYSGDTVGINWTYGRDYITSGCSTVSVGSANSNDFAGGAILIKNQGASYDGDGENPVDYTICSGHYAWDYSLTDIGSGLYMAEMVGVEPGNSSILATAHSPCFC